MGVGVVRPQADGFLVFLHRAARIFLGHQGIGQAHVTR